MGEEKHASIRVTQINRYPVKGLSPESLQSVQLKKGCTLPFDRAFAIEHGKGKFNPQNPRYLPKINFLMLMRNEKLAQLKTSFNERTSELAIRLDGHLVVEGRLDTPQGCKKIEDYMLNHMGDECFGRARILQAPDHSFSDVSAKCLHIINLNSVRALEKLAGKNIDPLRFRANLIIDGPPAFCELDWVGQSLANDDISLQIFKRTQRCLATNVDPDRAVRDMTIPELLFEHFGHRDFGIYATVKTAGLLTIKSLLELRSP